MSKESSLKATVLFILGNFFASVVILSFLYPDLWLFHTRRLLVCHETQVPLESTFILVSHFFHGGIQLWDRFDQVNNAYFVLSNGVYGIANILAALVYIIFSPFYAQPGDALYHIHLILYYDVTGLIRTIGGYVLLRKFVSSKVVIFISLIYLNTILTSYMMMPGFVAQGSYSYFPLLLYFILGFFEDLRLRTFLLAVLVMILSFVSSPLFTLGYFYQGAHFFILSCVVAFLFQRGWRVLKGRQPLSQNEWIKNLGLAAGGLFIVLPYCWWGHALLHDFYVYGSGLGGTQGRFNHILNLKGYFSVDGKSFSNPLELLGTSLDYHQNVWGASWLFIGASSFCLALIGIVLSKEKRKYLFLSTILGVILINTACFPGNFFLFWQYIKASVVNPSIGGAHGISLNDWMLSIWLMFSSMAHGINALTNPTSFLVRSFHMTSLLIPILLFPLIAMGLESCLQLWKHQFDCFHHKRRWALLAIFVLVLWWDLSGGTQALSVYNAGQTMVGALKDYILSIILIFIGVVIMPAILPANKLWVGRSILIFAFAIDIIALKVYVQPYSKDDYTVPVRIQPAYSHLAVLPDFQNPYLLPIREFLDVHSELTFPVINSSTCMYGAFYQYSPIGRFFHPWSIYEPRHISYRDLYPDPEIQVYLSRNPRAILFADYAFDSRYLGLAQILRLNLSQRVVLVDPNESNRAFLKTAERVYLTPQASDDKFYNFSFDPAKAVVHKGPWGWKYIFDLPKDFPSYLSTTVFTPDHASWKLMVNGRNLESMQGKLTSPYTFDVQNIQERKMTILLPGLLPSSTNINLQIKSPEKILDVWKNTYDDLGLTYQAPRTGWMVFHYPFDTKWELFIDGHKTPISRVNGYFIGAPIANGEHRILLRYWPHTPLRFLVFISMVMSLICFFRIMLYSIQQEPLYRG